MDILGFKYTYTTKFILPLLFKDKSNFNILFKESFINSYIADMSVKDNDDKIHLLFTDCPSLEIRKQLPDLITEYYHDAGYVIVCPIPIGYEEDYLKFLIGEYSKLSLQAKNKIIEFWQVNDNTLTYGVLFKTGKKVKEFYKYLLDKDLDDTSPSGEWWARPKIEHEILGLIT